MKTYIVYDTAGNERCYVKAKNQNAAAKKAEEKYGQGSSVVYTELGAEYDNRKGFFN